MKIGPVGAELFHADGRRDTMKLTAVPQFFERASELNVFLTVHHELTIY